jgi:hypothetical protein
MKVQTVTVEAAEGAIYEATREGGEDQPWEINFPVGADRFYGTVPELKAHIKGLIAIHSNADAE